MSNCTAEIEPRRLAGAKADFAKAKPGGRRQIAAKIKSLKRLRASLTDEGGDGGEEGDGQEEIVYPETHSDPEAPETKPIMTRWTVDYKNGVPQDEPDNEELLAKIDEAIEDAQNPEIDPETGCPIFGGGLDQEGVPEDCEALGYEFISERWAMFNNQRKDLWHEDMASTSGVIREAVHVPTAHAGEPTVPAIAQLNIVSWTKAPTSNDKCPEYTGSTTVIGNSVWLTNGRNVVPTVRNGANGSAINDVQLIKGGGLRAAVGPDGSSGLWANGEVQTWAKVTNDNSDGFAYKASGGGVIAGKGNAGGQLLLSVEVVFIENEDSTWQEEMLEKHVVLDDEELKFKIVIGGITETNQGKLEQMGFHHLLLTSTATRPALPTRMELFGPSTQIQVVNGSTEIRVTLPRDDLIEMDVVPEENEDGDDRERSSLDYASSTDSNFSDSEAFLYSGNGWKHKYRGYSLNDDSAALENSPFDSNLDLSFLQAGGAELLTVEVEGTSVKGLAMLMNQADYFYYSGHGDSVGNPGTEGAYIPGLDALGTGYRVRPGDISPYWDRDMDCAIIAGCAILNINNWVAIPAFYPPTTGPNANYWPGKAMENIGPQFLVGYGASAPYDTQNTASISSSFISSYDSSGNAFSSWRSANDNSNGRNAVAIQRGVKYGYFERSTFLGIPYYTWTEKAKVGDWVP